MKKSIALLLSVLLTAVLLTGCLPSADTVKASCITGVTMTDTESGKTTELQLVFDTSTGVLTAVFPKGRIEYTFDKNGELLSRYWYYSDGTVRDSVVQTFVDGKLIQTESYHNDNLSMPSTGKTECFYDESGTLEKTVGYRGDWLSSEVFFRKDGSIAQRISHVYGFGDGAIDIYTYAEDGRILSQKNMRDGKEDSGTDYVYDENGVLLQKISYINEGTRKENICTMHYDSKGNRVEYSIIDYQGNAKWYRYTYDENGNMLTRDYSEDGEGAGYVWTYDKEGRVISQKNGPYDAVHWTYDKEGQIATYRHYAYTYTYATLRLPKALADAVQEATDSMLHLFVTYPIDREWDP